MEFLKAFPIAIIDEDYMSALCQKQTLAPDANCCSSINNLLGAERRHRRLPAVDHYRSCPRRCSRLPKAERRRSRLPEGGHSWSQEDRRTRRGAHSHMACSHSCKRDSHSRNNPGDSIAYNNAANNQPFQWAYSSSLEVPDFRYRWLALPRLSRLCRY